MPAQSSPASTWIGARNFPAIPNVPNWNDWAVRSAGAYDLFGNGKTALKANAGKYVGLAAAGYAADFNGMSGATQTVGMDRPGRQRHDPRRAPATSQVNEVAARHRELRPDDGTPPGSGSAARLQLGVQRRPAARARAARLVTAGYYRRHTTTCRSTTTRTSVERLEQVQNHRAGR